MGPNETVVAQDFDGIADGVVMESVEENRMNDNIQRSELRFAEFGSAVCVMVLAGKI